MFLRDITAAEVSPLSNCDKNAMESPVFLLNSFRVMFLEALNSLILEPILLSNFNTPSLEKFDICKYYSINTLIILQLLKIFYNYLNNTTIFYETWIKKLLAYP